MPDRLMPLKMPDNTTLKLLVFSASHTYTTAESLATPNLAIAKRKLPAAIPTSNATLRQSVNARQPEGVFPPCKPPGISSSLRYAS